MSCSEIFVCRLHVLSRFGIIFLVVCGLLGQNLSMWYAVGPSWHDLKSGEFMQHYTCNGRMPAQLWLSSLSPLRCHLAGFRVRARQEDLGAGQGFGHCRRRFGAVIHAEVLRGCGFARPKKDGAIGDQRTGFGLGQRTRGAYRPKNEICDG